MALTHGMNIEEIEKFGHRLGDDYAVRIIDAANEIDLLVNELSGYWVGPDGERFRSWWPEKRARLRTMFEDVSDFGRIALKNASDQRLASGDAVPAVSGLGRSATGPQPFAVSEQTAEAERKSGAVVRGVDGSQLSYREMSDGTVEVTLFIENAVEADIGDGAEILGYAYGNFGGAGIEWDLDLHYSEDGAVTYTFSDAESGKRFFEELRREQDASTRFGNMSFNNIKAVARRLDGELEGDASWSGYSGSRRFTASGSIGLDAGTSGAHFELSEAVATARNTVASDGSTGELTQLSGGVSGSGTASYGDVSLDLSSASNYERDVHIIRNGAGEPVRLEVAEGFTAESTLTGGTHAAGTGHKTSAGETTGVSSTQVFDLTDPEVARSFGDRTSADDMYRWSQDNADLGGQTVTTFAGESSSSSWSMLFSAEWNSADSSSSITSAQYRPPGGEFQRLDYPH